MAAMAMIPELGPPGSLEVEPQLHFLGTGVNPAKCDNGVLPYTVDEFEYFASISNLADLVVENVTHWKLGPHNTSSTTNPYYHEFITVKTFPAPHVAFALDSELSRDSLRAFDWASIATRGLTFRIDRGQLPTPHQPSDHAGDQGVDNSIDPRAHLVPIDLVEIMHPDILDLRGSDGHVNDLHIGLDWPPHAPLLTFNRRDVDDPSLREDPCALRVRDFIFLLNRHSESPMIYVAQEWSTWELAPSIVRFLLRYRLVWSFDAVSFANKQTPLVPGPDAPQGQSIPRLGEHLVPRTTEPPLMTKGFEHAYRVETGAFLDEHIFGPENWIGAATDSTRDAALCHLPQRGYLGVLISMKPLWNAMHNPLYVGILTDCFGQLARWAADLRARGVLAELVDIVAAICSPRRDEIDASRTLHQFVVLNLVHLLRADHVTCLNQMREAYLVAKMVSTVQTTDDFELVEVVSLLFEVMSGFSLGVQELLAHVEVIPAMLRRASSDPSADPATVDRFCHTLAKHSSSSREALIRADFAPWAIEHLEANARFPGLTLATLSELLRPRGNSDSGSGSEFGLGEFSQAERELIAHSKIPKLLHGFVEDHPNRRYDGEEPQSRQGLVLRSHALRVLRLLAQSIPRHVLGLDGTSGSLSILRDALNSPHLKPWEAHDAISLLLCHYPVDNDQSKDETFASIIPFDAVQRVAAGAAIQAPHRESWAPETSLEEYISLLDSLSIIGPACRELVRSASGRYHLKILPDQLSDSPQPITAMLNIA